MPDRADFNEEMADLVAFMSRVAVTIRLYTPYACKNRNRAEENSWHILWLADSIHEFEDLANAVKRGDPQEILRAANQNRNLYRKYRTVGNAWGSDPMQTFQGSADEHEHRSNTWILEEVSVLLGRIEAKAQALLSGHGCALSGSAL